MNEVAKLISASLQNTLDEAIGLADLVASQIVLCQLIDCYWADPPSICCKSAFQLTMTTEMNEKKRLLVH